MSPASLSFIQKFVLMLFVLVCYFTASHIQSVCCNQFHPLFYVPTIMHSALLHGMDVTRDVRRNYQLLNTSKLLLECSITTQYKFNVFKFSYESFCNWQYAFFVIVTDCYTVFDNSFYVNLIMLCETQQSVLRAKKNNCICFVQIDHLN